MVKVVAEIASVPVVRTGLHANLFGWKLDKLLSGKPRLSCSHCDLKIWLGKG